MLLTAMIAVVVLVTAFAGTVGWENSTEKPPKHRSWIRAPRVEGYNWDTAWGECHPKARQWSAEKMSAYGKKKPRGSVKTRSRWLWVSGSISCTKGELSRHWKARISGERLEIKARGVERGFSRCCGFFAMDTSTLTDEESSANNSSATNVWALTSSEDGNVAEDSGFPVWGKSCCCCYCSCSAFKVAKQKACRNLPQLFKSLHSDTFCAYWSTTTSSTPAYLSFPVQHVLTLLMIPWSTDLARAPMVVFRSMRCLKQVSEQVKLQGSLKTWRGRSLYLRVEEAVGTV